MKQRTIRKETHELRLDADHGSRAVPLTLRFDHRARSLTLRVDTKAEAAVVTVPHGLNASQALDFAQRRAGWVAARLGELAERTPFVDGATLPYMGEILTIKHCVGARGTVWRDGGNLCVAGRAEHLSRRITDWLKAEARARIGPTAREFANQLGESVGRITLRDTRSRWASCTAAGNLNFSWRLILAPPDVLAYVVAHEVAHRKHMNHSADFWAVVDQLIDDVNTPKRWLKKHGAALHRVG